MAKNKTKVRIGRMVKRMTPYRSALKALQNAKKGNFFTPSAQSLKWFEQHVKDYAPVKSRPDRSMDELFWESYINVALSADSGVGVVSIKGPALIASLIE